jgi:hypothetical protein
MGGVKLDRLFEDPKHVRRDMIDLRMLMRFGDAYTPEDVTEMLKMVKEKMTEPGASARVFYGGMKVLFEGVKLQIEAQKLEMVKNAQDAWDTAERELEGLVRLASERGVSLAPGAPVSGRVGGGAAAAVPERNGKAATQMPYDPDAEAG